MTKILIHSVNSNGMGVFICSHPECSFMSTSLTDVAEHTVKNQFVVREPVRKKPTNLFKI